MVLKSRYFLVIIFISLILLSACKAEEIQALEIPQSSGEDDLPELIPSPVPERTLSICLGDEPDSLFLYGDQSASAVIIRQAIYDSPVDEVDFQFSSTLLEEIPSQLNGLVAIVPVEVYPGEKIVDSKGNISILASGVEYRPADCSAPDCFETYQNQSPVILEQVEINFPMKSGINWADGNKLTAVDSEFSFRTAKELYGSRGPRSIRYTASYEAVDARTILWKGLPGFLGIYSYPEYFFSPLPQHLLANLTIDEMLTSERATRQPLSWGPYRVTDWVLGDHLTLLRNENYHLNSAGLPIYDALVFRFMDNGEEALAAYFSGECEIVANEPGLFDFLPELLVREKERDLRINFIEGGAWEQVSFGINSLDSKRVLLQDSRTRQAIAQCINREEISRARGDAGSAADSFFMPGDPRITSQSSANSYQPTAAVDLLEEIGWIDHDQDQNTPRVAQWVTDVKDGTPFQLTLLTAGVDEVPISTELIRDDLKSCGIEVEIELLPASELLAPGPEGPIFGRNFDLAQFAWTTGNYNLCVLFITNEIPGPYPAYPKGWGGANASGYSNPDFDETCSLILGSLPDQGSTLEAYQTAQQIFSEDLPVLPLFFRRDIILTSPKLEEFQSGSFQPLWNIESVR